MDQEVQAAVCESGDTDELMQGRSADRFDPQASTTRAEAAVVLKRMLQTAGFMNK
ncbi:S-layer homology domain-containing protein [Paenibacillus dakarensis]|uniref:S-layer homology domain-containing protein n=1 Tax=Paenibacillus dakarensis TaxID=1527293 RepID=UPI0012E2F2C1|nr:S-layer homology domain-containing protein [Paenibacillus dakarensis]